MKLGNSEKEYSKMVAEIETVLHEHEKRFVQKLIPLPNKPKRLLGRNGVHYLLDILFRSRCLTDGLLFSLNNSNLVVSKLIVRAHFEISAALAYFLKKLRLFYMEKITLDEINDILDKLTFGIKIDNFIEDAPKPFNVVKLLDAADDVLKNEIQDKEKSFRKVYEWLSEYCHPNSFSLLCASTTDENGVVHFSQKVSSADKDLSVISHFLFSINLFLFCFDEAINLMVKNEEIFYLFQGLSES